MFLGAAAPAHTSPRRVALRAAGVWDARWSTDRRARCACLPLSVTRYFTLVLGVVSLPQPDGSGVKRALAVNGTSPGPEIRVNHGDWLEVTVLTTIPNDNTTMHWRVPVRHRSNPALPPQLTFAPSITQQAGRAVLRVRPF